MGNYFVFFFQRLYEAWANPKKAFIWQPLDLIRWVGLFITFIDTW